MGGDGLFNDRGSERDGPYVTADKLYKATLGVPRFKHGHVCCGCFCDVRRATIIVDFISVALNVLALFIVIAIEITEIEGYRHEQVRQLVQTFPFLFTVLWILISMFVHNLGIIGAMEYKISYVAAALVMHLASFVVALAAFNPIGAVIAALFAYPHIFFIMEVHKGTMSAENYRNEEKSCCCV